MPSTVLVLRGGANSPGRQKAVNPIQEWSLDFVLVNEFINQTVVPNGIIGL